MAKDWVHAKQNLNHDHLWPYSPVQRQWLGSEPVQRTVDAAHFHFEHFNLS